MDRKIILGRILQRFIDQGYAQVVNYNRFDFIKINKLEVWVTRETGQDTPIPFAKILSGIEAYIKHPELYTKGPTPLREFGITHVTSPVFAFQNSIRLNSTIRHGGKKSLPNLKSQKLTP